MNMAITSTFRPNEFDTYLEIYKNDLLTVCFGEVN